MSNNDLSNKFVLVTGATSGIGKQIALSCISAGANVIFTGRSSDKIHKLKQSFGNSHAYIQADLSKDEDIERVTDLCPQLDGLVHCAGLLKTIPVKFISRELLNEIMNVNYYSSVLLTTSLLKSKKINKNASIVFISSISGNYVALKGNALYSASKGAVNAYAKVLALELSSMTVRVNTISPGMIHTNLWTNELSSLSTDQIEEDKKKYPLGYGQALDVAEATVFLLSNRSKWITGTDIVLDGGFTIQ